MPANKKKRMLCEDERDRLLAPRARRLHIVAPARRARPANRRGHPRPQAAATSHRRTRSLSGAILGLFLVLGAVFAADPTAPTEPAAPSIPSLPTSAPSAPSGASPAAPAIPGYGPGEGLPAEGSGPADLPQMELIPPGTVPLQPVPNLPGLDLGPNPLVAQPAQAVELKNLKYKVSKFNIKYGPPSRKPNPRLPPAESLLKPTVTLGIGSDGLSGPDAAERELPVTLSQIKTTETFSGEALQVIYVSIVKQINRLGIYGVFVVVDPDQVDPTTGEDKRKPGDTSLTLLVYASEVVKIRTIVKPVAKPPFKSASTTIDDPKYAKITTHSPLKPPPGKDKPGSLLFRASLQNYLDRINRFPGRRVDVAVTASGQDAGVILDYIVHAETPAVFLFDQTSNTGTQASGTWRTRAGVEVRQLAGLDDVLDASFESSLSTATYSAFGSYQITPLFPDLLKFKLYGGYGKFLAEDVGFDEAKFEGRSSTVGALAIYTPLYFKGFPIDLIGGVEYKYVDINDLGASSPEGKTSFLLPILGVATDKTTDLFAAFGSAQIEPNLASVIGTSETQLQDMGREKTDKEFIIGKYNLGLSMFLEPILFKKTWKAYQDETDPAARKGYWKRVQLAQEVSFLLHGQYTFDNKRLIPQFQDVIGGFASVRGYPEAFTAGDNTIVFNGEYRYHVLRILKPFDTDQVDDPTKPPPPPPKFALRPPTILGRPDLDVILRIFFDFGYAEENNIAAAGSLEADRVLASVGAGVEVQVMRYLNLRLDCGIPLISVREQTSRPVDEYSPRLSFVGVISY